jgi:THO complex subunit 2
LALQEQERVANEEEEKRLKAALKAKREPSAATSRVSSPSIGATGATKDTIIEQKPSGPETSSTEDVNMEAESPAVRFQIDASLL